MAEGSVFLPAFGNRPAQLVGRDTVVSNFVNGLDNPVGHPDRTTLLIGQRGMGKTALLLEFADKAIAKGHIVARVTASDEMLDDILGMIQRNGYHSVKDKLKLKGVSAGAFGFSVGLTFSEEVDRSYSFLNKLILLCDVLDKQGKGIVILVDEVQARTPAMRTLVTAYQHLIGEQKNIAIAMAGLPHVISSVLSDDVLTFLNRAKKVYLDPLPLESVRVYYSKVFQRLDKILPPDELDRSVEATRGYPYLLQLIGYYLTEYSEQSEIITGDVVTKALLSARRDLVSSVYEPVLKPLSGRDQAFLKAMSRDRSPSKVADIAKRLETTQNNVQAYRRRLIEAGVIASERRGELEFVIPYLGEYLRGEL
jgi:hypothetical protein